VLARLLRTTRNRDRGFFSLCQLDEENARVANVRRSAQRTSKEKDKKYAAEVRAVLALNKRIQSAVTEAAHA